MLKQLANKYRFALVYGGAVLTAIVLMLLPQTLQPIAFGMIILFGVVGFVSHLSNTHPLHLYGKIRYFQKTHPARFATINAIIGAMILCASAWFYQPEYIVQFYGFYLFVLSLPFLWLGRTAFQFDSYGYEVPRVTEQPSVRWVWIAVAMLAFVVLMTINIPNGDKSEWHTMLGLVDVPTGAQLVLLGIGLGGLILGFRANLLPTKIQWRRYHLILLALVLLGGGVRAWNLEYTLHLFVDELFFMNDVSNIRDATPPLLLPDNSPSTDVYSFFQMLAVQLVGPSLLGLRLPSPIISMFGLIVVYAFARQLFSVRVALLSAFLFAVLPVHIQFGRIGMNMIVDPIFGMLGFIYLIRAMQSRHTGDFALVGIMFGMTHYFYEGGRIFFTAFLLCWLIWMTIFGRRDPIFRLPSWQDWGALLFCLIVVSTPIYHTRIAFDMTLTERFDATRNPDFTLSDRVDEFVSVNEIGYLGAPLHRYVHDIARDNFFRSDFAYVMPILAPFFMIGFGLLLLQLHRMQGALLLWWIIGVAIGNSLIADLLSAPSPRYIVVYAVLMIIVAVGIDRIWHLLEKYLHRYRHAITGIFLLYLGYVGIYQIDYYFSRTVPLYYERIHTTVIGTGRVRPDFDDMILRAVDLPENYSVQVFTNALFPKTHHIDIPEFYQRDDLDVDYGVIRELQEHFFQALPRDVNYVFTFTRFHQEQMMDIIDDYFVVTHIEGSPYNIPPNAEILFAYAPLSANPLPEPIEFEFERAPNARP